MPLSTHRAAQKVRGCPKRKATEMKVVVIFLAGFLEGGPVRPSMGFPELPRAAREPARCWNITDLNAFPRYSHILTLHVACWAH